MAPVLSWTSVRKTLRARVRGKGCGEGSAGDIPHLCARVLMQAYKPKTRLNFREADETITVGRKMRRSSTEFSLFTYSLHNCFSRTIKEGMSHTSCTPEAEAHAALFCAA